MAGRSMHLEQAASRRLPVEQTALQPTSLYEGNLACASAQLLSLAAPNMRNAGTPTCAALKVSARVFDVEAALRQAEQARGRIGLRIELEAHRHPDVGCDERACR